LAPTGTSIDEEILIAVLGVTGAGKSTFINRATESNILEVGHDIISCTKQVACVKTKIGGRIVTLIDTPGFDDTYMSDGEVLSRIAQWLTETYQHGMLLTGVILLQPVDGNRAYGSEARRTRLFRKICGRDTYDNVVIGTTMWSKLRDRSEGVRQVEQRKASGDFWANLVNEGAKLVEHNDTKESAHNIIGKLMNKTKKPLQLQTELAGGDGRLYDTSAAQQLFQDLGTISALEKEKLDGIFNEMRLMRKSADSYRAEIAELQRKIDILQEQKKIIRDETVRAHSTAPDWIQALAAAGTVAVGAAAVLVPLAAGGACIVM
jgi:hypothetical protein